MFANLLEDAMLALTDRMRTEICDQLSPEHKALLATGEWQLEFSNYKTVHDSISFDWQVVPIVRFADG